MRVDQETGDLKLIAEGQAAEQQQDAGELRCACELLFA